MFLRKYGRHLEFWAATHAQLVLKAFAVSCLFCFGPWIGAHFSHLWQRQHYQFFPMLLIGLGGLCVERWKASPSVVTDSAKMRVHLPLLFLSFASLFVAFAINSPWMGFLSACAMLLLFARNVPGTAPLVLPLLTLLPLPFAMDADIVHSLQRVSSAGASALLDFVGIPHLMSGNVLEFAGRHFFIEEACSGIGSIFLLLGSATIYAVWRQLRAIVTLPLMAFSVFWAVATNTLRIFAVALSYSLGGPDLDMGILHQVLGSATYIAAMALVLLTEQFLLFFFDSVPPFERTIRLGDKPERFAASLSRTWNGMTQAYSFLSAPGSLSRPISGWLVSRQLFLVTLSVVFGLGSIANGVQMWRTTRATMVVKPRTSPDRFNALPSELFTADDSSIVMKSFEEIGNDRSNQTQARDTGTKIWTLEIAGTPVTAIISGPHSDWPDARKFFQSEGWTVLESFVHEVPEFHSNEKIVSELLLLKDSTHYQQVFSSVLGPSAVPVAIPSEIDLSTIKSGGLGEHVFSGQKNLKDSMWEFQLRIIAERPFDAAARSFWREAFSGLLSTLMDRWRLQH